MERNFEEIRKAAHFHWKSYANLNGIPTFAFLSWSPGKVMGMEGPESIKFRGPGLNALVRAETFFTRRRRGTRWLIQKMFSIQKNILIGNIFINDSEAIRVMTENNILTAEHFFWGTRRESGKLIMIGEM